MIGKDDEHARKNYLNWKWKLEHGNWKGNTDWKTIPGGRWAVRTNHFRPMKSCLSGLVPTDLSATWTNHFRPMKSCLSGLVPTDLSTMWTNHFTPMKCCHSGLVPTDLSTMYTNHFTPMKSCLSGLVLREPEIKKNCFLSCGHLVLPTPIHR